MHADLLETARKLVCSPAGLEPTQTDLRRAVSTTYYAVFHHILQSSADLLAGADGKSMNRAKLQVYWSIDHRDVLAACERAKSPDVGFPKSIADYGTLVLNLHRSRCKADYDPSPDGDFNKPQVINKIGEAEEGIRRFDLVDAADRRAFAVLVAVKAPRGDRR